MKKMLLLAFVVCLAILAMAKQMVYSAGNLETEKIVVVDKGTTSTMVARKLFIEGVISHPLLFRIVARIKGLDKTLKAGEYLFASHISLIEVIEQMAKGEIMYRK
ncbi:MAG: endolytic transglycosylase MltG, partial [Alphaproteobacteria bacterium]|nr:endolytic transglycosylase MltG [Alphaproteobacteria bacterium]